MEDEFKQQLLTIYSHGTLSVTIALGIKLGLFDALANFTKENPATAEDIAEKLDFKPRYVFEWLSAMVCGDIIETDKEGKKFWIPDYKRGIISGEKDPIFVINMLVPMIGTKFEDLAKVFKKDGPQGISLHDHSHGSQPNGHGHGHSHAHDHSHSSPSSGHEHAASHTHDHSQNHDDFHHQHNHNRGDKGLDAMEIAVHATFKKYVISDYVVKLGVKDKLEEGIDVLDVGCGPGMQVMELAQHFPKSRFIGFDVSEQAIEKANKKKAENGLQNVEFLCFDAKEFKSEWEGKFGLVISFNSYHHHIYPEKGIKEVYRVLKQGGLFALTELGGPTDNAYNDKKKNALKALSLYNMGLFQRKPEEDPNKETVGMFSLWGIEKVTKTLNEIGFKDVKAEETKLFELNVIYLARK